MEITNEKYDSLKKIIEDSGHPVSLKVSTILLRKGWYVRNSPRYAAENETDVLKEIDIVSGKESKIFKSAQNTLIIECKNKRTLGYFLTKNKKMIKYSH